MWWLGGIHIANYKQKTVAEVVVTKIVTKLFVTPDNKARVEQLPPD